MKIRALPLIFLAAGAFAQADDPDTRQLNTNAAGQIVRQVQHTSGAVIEYTLDCAGKILNTRVISGATSGTRR